MKQILKKVGAFSSALALSVSSLAILAVPSVHAAQVTFTWDGGATPDCSASNGTNWAGDAVPTAGPGDTIVLEFPASSTDCRTVEFDLNLTVDAINFTGAFPGSPYTINDTGDDNPITIADGGSITNSGTGDSADHIVASDLVLDGSATIANTANVQADLNFNGGVTVPAASTLTVNAPAISDPVTEEGKVDFSNSISGNGSLAIGSGVVRTSALNTFAGNTTIASGALFDLAGVFASSGDTAGKTIVASGGAIKLATDVAAEPYEISGFGNTLSVDGVGAIISNIDNINLDDVTLLADAGICSLTDKELNLVSPTVTTFTLYDMGDTDCPGVETVDGTDSISSYTGGPVDPTPVDCTTPTTLASGTVADGACAEVAVGDTYTGDVTVTGTLIVDGTVTGNVTVDGTLMGSGTVTGAVNVSATGSLAPGNSPGCMVIGAGLTFVPGSSYDVEIQDGTACTGYDQAQVTGAVDVTGATLNATAFGAYDSTTFTAGDEFVIIDNDAADAVLGEFTNYAEGDTVTIGTGEYTISYAGGDNNDVSLTYTGEVATLPTTGGGDTPTPTATPGTPDTGFGAMLTNPATVMFSTTAIAGAILAIARKYNLLKG